MLNCCSVSPAWSGPSQPVASPCVPPCTAVPAQAARSLAGSLVMVARFVLGNKFSCIHINYLLFILLPLYNLSQGDGVDAGGSGE